MKERIIDIIMSTPGVDVSDRNTARKLVNHLLESGVSMRIDSDNPYWQRIEALATRQREKGIATYGQGIELNPADAITRLAYLQEELIDALMYCEWIKDKLSEPKA